MKDEYFYKQFDAFVKPARTVGKDKEGKPIDLGELTDHFK